MPVAGISPAFEEEVGEVHSIGQIIFACGGGGVEVALMIFADWVEVSSPHQHALLISAANDQNTGDVTNFLMFMISPKIDIPIKRQCNYFLCY